MRLFRKTLALSALTGLLACSGCYRHYVVKLTNGSQYATVGKPKLQPDGAYHFTDVRGRELTVPSGRVSVVQPAAMAEEEEAQGQTKAPPSKHKHWYWPF